MRWRLPLAGYSTLLVAVVWASRGHLLPQRLADAGAPPATKKTPPMLMGAGSCAAQACHNADRGTGFRGREYAIALQRDSSFHPPRVLDKHAQAYAVLFNKHSERMLRAWKGLGATQAVHPEREALCLRCHVHPQFDSLPVHVDQGVRQFRLEDGVSCEACHGPAQHWLAAHFRPGWSESRRAASGMIDTRSILGRVRMCLDCHVGSPKAQVDHDLVAAGHPWLRFDMGKYHSRWHKHWDAAKDTNPAVDPRGRSDFDAQLRQVGNVAVAQAALRLVADRARDKHRPWPEFADYDCRSCHHDLKSPSDWLMRARQAGKPELNHWHIELLAAAKLNRDIAPLSAAFSSWRPDRETVSSGAQSLARGLEDWLTTWKRKQQTP